MAVGKLQALWNDTLARLRAAFGGATPPAKPLPPPPQLSIPKHLEPRLTRPKRKPAAKKMKPKSKEK